MSDNITLYSRDVRRRYIEPGKYNGHRAPATGRGNMESEAARQELHQRERALIARCVGGISDDATARIMRTAGV